MSQKCRLRVFVPLLGVVTASASTAHAEELDAPADPAPQPSVTPATKRKRYTLPFSLRPAVAPDLARVDSAFAFQDKASSAISTATFGMKPFVGTDLGLYGRIAVAQNAPEGARNAAAISNPIAFALYTPEVAPKLRLPLFVGITLPVGMGGGDVPATDAVRSSVASGVYGRQAMDNALFAVNYVTTTAGVGVAWIDRGITLQMEATVLYLVRVKGESIDKEPARTNFTSGVHAGYLVAEWINVGVEAHYQRWLSTPVVVQKDDSFRDQATVGGGARFNLPLSDTVLARPGIAYFHPIDDPMGKQGYRIVQLDVPVTF